MAKVKLLDPSDPRRKLDRYELIGEIATGGMATVFLARRGGVGGFQRFNAIKRLHPHLANEPEFVEMFLDEARLAALIHHPNVVPILEVGETEAGYYLVMEYVEGDTLSRIVARTMSLGQMPPRHVILRTMLDALAGLHAAHELRDDRGALLGLVHRDCSPQNILVGVDGSTRITDFGVARASSRLTSTAHGKLKGKLAYMAPEQTRGDELDRRTDLFAMGIILWEVLCGKRLFKADSEAATLQRILVEPIRKPSELNPSVPKQFDAVVLKALDRDAEKRFQTAADFGDALEAAGREAAKGSVTDVGIASPREVASFVQSVLGQEIGAQRESVRAWLAQSDSGQPIVIHGTGSNRPSAGGTDSGQTRKDSPNGLAQGAAAADEAPPPSTRIEAGKQTRSNPPPGDESSPHTDRQPRPVFEVAADVTMRFALEAAKQDPPPPPSSPPPSSSRIGMPAPPSGSAPQGIAPPSGSAPQGIAPPSGSAPQGIAPPSGSAPQGIAPPRVPPPKQSSPTLLGQGPVAQQISEAARAAMAMNGASFEALVAEANAQPPTLREMPESPIRSAAPSSVSPSSAIASSAVPSSGTARALDRAADQVAAGGYVPQVTDDLEDAITVARPGHGPHSVIQPQVKTQRGLVAEPLLAEARARAEASIDPRVGRDGANGHANGAQSSTMSVVKTPRMPMPVDQSGVDPRAHANAGAAIIAGVPEAQPLAPGARHPRTLVSATPAGLPGHRADGDLRSSPPASGGEVSNGGFTPSSMTLPSDHAAFHNDALDPTVVHSIPKRRVGKIAVVLAAFLLVFGAGLLLLKARSDGQAEAEQEKPKAAATPKETATAKPAPLPTATATATAEPSASTLASESAPSSTTKAVVGPIRKGGPRVEKTSKPTSTSEPTSKPKDPGEDLSNPYR